MIIPHWSQVPYWVWPNFTPKELSSPDNGQIYFWPEFMDRLQAARTAVGKPFRINSAHRSWRHNLKVGGAPNSQHKKLAVDISLHGHNRFELLGACRGAGFTGFGFANTFLHLDMGPRRFWYYGARSKEAWNANS